jgi:glutaredoxin
MFFTTLFLFVRAESLPRDQLPKITLYTKDPCPLCDELKAKLVPYMHRIQFESVDITKKENVRWLRLYRYEIPVVFLNGEYLCKHSLDENLLDRRLKIIESR